MTMLDIFKNTLQNGMEITKVKEMANEYRITLTYNGMVGHCGVSKMCTPGNETSLCMKSIDTAISGMYINAGNLQEAQAWLDGERWNLQSDNPDDRVSKYYEKVQKLLEDAINDGVEINVYTTQIEKQGKMVTVDNGIVVGISPIDSVAIEDQDFKKISTWK